MVGLWLCKLARGIGLFTAGYAVYAVGCSELISLGKASPLPKISTTRSTTHTTPHCTKLA